MKRRGQRRPETGEDMGWRRLESQARLMAAMLAMSGGFLLAAPTVNAQKTSHDDVQAAYLSNFGKFVRWPQAIAGSPLEVCVAGRDGFRQAVAKLVAGEEIEGRRVVERDLENPSSVEDCSILFVGTGDRARDDSFLGTAEGKPILTVGESADFLVRGGVIQFVVVEDHVRFAVNLEAANRHRIVLSSELIKVAATVTGNPGTGGVR